MFADFDYTRFFDMSYYIEIMKNNPFARYNALVIQPWIMAFTVSGIINFVLCLITKLTDNFNFFPAVIAKIVFRVLCLATNLVVFSINLSYLIIAMQQGYKIFVLEPYQKYSIDYTDLYGYNMHLWKGFWPGSKKDKKVEKFNNHVPKTTQNIDEKIKNDIQKYKELQKIESELEKQNNNWEEM